jgi:YHS domain-containing protein
MEAAVSQTIVWFLIWGALIFFMMRFGCGSHVMGHGGHRGHDAHSPSSGEPERAAPEQEVDPVCGMTVLTRDAKTAVHEGRVYYFCSQTCREKFEAAPASYTSPTRESAAHEGHHHG